MLKRLTKQDIAPLKEFARTMIWAFPVIFMLALPWIFDAAIPWWPAAISLSLILMYSLYPPALYYPYVVWGWISGVLGWINTRIILGLVFYGLILPIGLVLRLLGKLQYHADRPLKKDPAAQSAWIKRDTPLNKNDLENPF